jgi:hypothetical protein
MKKNNGLLLKNIFSWHLTTRGFIFIFILDARTSRVEWIKTFERNTVKLNRSTIRKYIVVKITLLHLYFKILALQVVEIYRFSAEIRIIHQ